MCFCHGAPSAAMIVVVLMFVEDRARPWKKVNLHSSIIGTTGLNLEILTHQCTRSLALVNFRECHAISLVRKKKEFSFVFI